MFWRIVLHYQGKLVWEEYSWTAGHWWWRHSSLPKCWELVVSLHGITSQKTWIFILDTQIRQFTVLVWPGKIHFRLLQHDLLVQLFWWILLHTSAAMLKWSSMLSFWADCERSIHVKESQNVHAEFCCLDWNVLGSS